MKLFSVKISAKNVAITFKAKVFLCVVDAFSLDSSNTFLVWYACI